MPPPLRSRILLYLRFSYLPCFIPGKDSERQAQRQTKTEFSDWAVPGRILSSRRQIYSKAQGVQYLSAAFMLFYPKHPFHFGKYT